jgi:hypothetical protein
MKGYHIVNYKTNAPEQTGLEGGKNMNITHSMSPSSNY